MVSRIAKIIRILLSGLISIFYSSSDKCILCDNYCDEYLCNSCKSQINIIGIKKLINKGEEGYISYSLGFYSYGIKKLILKFKFQKCFEAGEILARYLTDFIINNLMDKIDIITFIPSSRSSMKRRGFNQCRVLCEYIYKFCKIPFEETLKKSHDVEDQIGLSDIKRWKNIEGSFFSVNEKIIIGRRILIIDDVITTGATAFCAASTLKKSGAKEVYILTVAKSRV